MESSSDIRQSYLDFFGGYAHHVLPSASLIPLADPSLLLVNAGMAPLKRYFEGKEAPPAPRLASCQKCLRTVDIDRVGYTNRHNTFFEMLGNFSIGDYFKREAIIYAWEYLTDKRWLGMDPKFLYVTVHEKDDESPLLWEREVGVSPSRIFRLSDEHNLWTAGEVGPCGYDTEIFFDLERGTEIPCANADEFSVLENAGRMLEVWNLVFMEFNRDAKGKLTPLPSQNVDTGMGLERAACVLQGKTTVFESDLFDYLVDYYHSLVAQSVGGKVRGFRVAAEDLPYEPFWVLADHTRAAVFLLADGITPSNLDRGYVLRRLIRGILKTTYLLGVRGSYLTEPAELVIGKMGEFYPELASARQGILTWLSKEEESFFSVLERGSADLSAAIKDVWASGERVISGKLLFTLHDTYGFPFEVAKEFALSRGYEVNEQEFDEEMAKQRQRARSAKEFATDFGTSEVTQMDNHEAKFLGYELLSATASYVGMQPFSGKLDVKEKDADALSEIEGKQLFFIYTDATPFYAETGGQPADTGYITADGLRFRVIGSKTLGEHLGFFVEGGKDELKEGMQLALEVDEPRRRAIMRAHTMAHAMLAAMRKVLGEHVSQAGSQLYPDRVRFDFSHYQAMTDKEMQQVEALVNETILADYPVWTQEMPLVEAKKQGVTAVFDEKYGETVRVVNIGEEGAQVSRELCGGTHLTRTSQAGSFVLVHEESVQSGVRRVEAAVGMEAFRFLQQYRWTATTLMREFRVRLDELAPAVAMQRERMQAMHEELTNLKRGALYDEIAPKVASPERVGEVSLVVAEVEDVTKDDVKTVLDRAERELAKAGAKPYAVLIVNRGEKRFTLSLKLSNDLPPKGIKAGALIREVAKLCGGGGGGKDLFAEAGAKDASKLPEAIAKLKDLLGD